MKQSLNWHQYAKNPTEMIEHVCIYLFRDMRHNFNKYSTRYMNDQGVAYDYESVMQYGEKVSVVFSL